MNYQKAISLLAVILLLSISLEAQYFSTEKAQVKISVAMAACQFETKTTTVQADVETTNNTCTFKMPVAAFQVDERNKKVAFTEDCFPLEGFPMISFRGKLEGSEDWKTGKDGSYQMKLTGQLNIKGMDIPFSENVLLQMEGGQLTLAFNTSLKVAEAEVTLEGDFILVMRNLIEAH